KEKARPTLRGQGIGEDQFPDLIAGARQAMAKQSAKKRTPPRHYQQRGATFAVPLEDGRYGACRVLRVRPEAEISLFAATDYAGQKPPELADPLLRSILVMNSLACDNWRFALWQYWIEPPPATFKYLGMVEPSPAEERLNPDAYSKFWNDYADSILQEWR